jgi:hypothetical protein
MFKGKDWIDWLQTGTRGELLWISIHVRMYFQKDNPLLDEVES